MIVGIDGEQGNAVGAAMQDPAGMEETSRGHGEEWTGENRLGFRGGRDVNYPEGRFQVRTFEGSKRVWKNAGLDATDALAMRDRVARRREIIVQAGVAGVEVKEEKGRVAIRPAVTRYLQHCRQVEAEVASVVYGGALADFMRSLPDEGHRARGERR
jgi:hypothetical protein